MSQAGIAGSDGTSESGIVTIDGDTGSITGSTVTIYSNVAAKNSGSTVQFVNSGTTSTLNLSNNNFSTAIGNLANAGSGANNTCIGVSAGQSLTSGIENCIVGAFAAYQLVNGIDNTLIGHGAGINYVSSESSNICLGNPGVGGESNQIRIGNQGTGTSEQDACNIAGIYGSTIASGVPVFIDSSGNLGTIVSSQRFKKDIQDLKNESNNILNLRPVTFLYKSQKDNIRQTGLIAEEVQNIMPSLVILDDEGQPFSVKYHDLPVMLLNELQKALKRIEILEEKIN